MDKKWCYFSGEAEKEIMRLNDEQIKMHLILINLSNIILKRIQFSQHYMPAGRAQP